MPDLREQLHHCFQGRVCLVGVGNVDWGDDGFGVRLAEALGKSELRNSKSETNPNVEIRNHHTDADVSDCGFRDCFGLRISDFGFASVIVAGTTPERVIGRLAEAGFDHLVFLDAVEFGAAPGSVTFLNAEAIAARFPQVSTHKLSLGLLAKMVEADGLTKVWLLGVQPESLKAGEGLTPAVQRTLEVLRDLLAEMPAGGWDHGASAAPEGWAGEKVRKWESERVGAPPAHQPTFSPAHPLFSLAPQRRRGERGSLNSQESGNQTVVCFGGPTPC